MQQQASAVDLVGVVATDIEQVAAYLELGPVGPYVVIRAAADVPAKLGGVAILTGDPLEPALRDALLLALSA